MRARLASVAVLAGFVIAVGACASTPEASNPSTPTPPPASSMSLTAAEVAGRHVDGLPTEALSSATGREVYSVTSVAEFVKLSGLVIIGTALAVAPGITVGEPTDGQLQWRDVGVEVEEVIHGTYNARTLTVEELGWHEGKPTTLNHASWARVGDRMRLGLRRTDRGDGIGGPRFVLTSTATRFYLTSDGQVDDNYVDDDEINTFVRDAAATSADDLLAEVRAQR
jgi:hypothetical protein